MYVNNFFFFYHLNVVLLRIVMRPTCVSIATELVCGADREKVVP